MLSPILSQLIHKIPMFTCYDVIADIILNKQQKQAVPLDNDFL